MHAKVYLFIGVSALIHISVLGILSQKTNELTPVEHGRSAIAVEITQSKNTVRKQDVVKSEKKAAKHNTTENPEKSNQKTTSVLNNLSVDSVQNLEAIRDKSAKNLQSSESLVVEAENIVLPIPANNHTDDEINTEAIMAVLREELSKYFYYPASAQRKNWEGQVVLSFTIMPDGVIHEININKSSGYDVLDNAAIEALGEVKKHEELALALNGSSHEQLLPVIYKLTD